MQTHPDRGSFGIGLRVLARAPMRTKLMVAFMCAFIILDFFLEARHWLRGTSSGGVFKFVGVISAELGILVLATALLLHAVGEHAPNLFGGGALERWRPSPMLLALPLLAYVAGALLMLGIGLQLPVVMQSPERIFIVVTLGMLTLVGGFCVSRSARLLYQHAQQQAEAAALAQEEATEAQLAALQAQMNPHFLFNALNTVASLVRTDTAAAERTVENLARVLRRTLDRTRRSLCRLEEEVEDLRAYLLIEQERFGDRLQVDWQLEKASLDAQIPPMTLQPLVENALKHGLGASLKKSRVIVGSSMQGGMLALEVTDDGAGFPATFKEGTGLGNLRERLRTLFGSEATLTVNSSRAGSTVRIELPARVAVGA